MHTARLLTVSNSMHCAGGVSQHALRQTPSPPLPYLREQNGRQVQKYYLAPNFVCGR